MKAKIIHQTLPLVLALCFSPGNHSVIAGETNSPAVTTAEGLGYDIYEGKTNKIARVYAVTPTHVQVLHEGGKSGRNIPRQNLPPELAAKYPYDAAKATEYQQQQMDIAVHQVEAQRKVMEDSARRREQALADQIAALRTQAQRLEADFHDAKRLPGKFGKKEKVANALTEHQRVRDQIAKLEDQLSALRASRNHKP